MLSPVLVEDLNLAEAHYFILILSSLDNKSMEKVNILGTGNEGSRNYFTFEKNLEVFSPFLNFLKNVDLEKNKSASFCSFDEKIRFN